MQGNKHHWTFNEDKYCCQKYIEFYIINRSDMDISSFICLLHKDLPDIQNGSLRMKIQNIKQLLIEFDIKDTLKIKPLINYSVQNKKAIIEVLQEIGINTSN